MEGFVVRNEYYVICKGGKFLTKLTGDTLHYTNHLQAALIFDSKRNAENFAWAESLEDVKIMRVSTNITVTEA